TTPVYIDGYSQRPCGSNSSPCSQANTASNGTNALLTIELNGSLAGSVDGFVVNGGGSLGNASVVSGLVVNRFGGNGVALAGGGYHTLSGNFIGTDVSGTLSAANGTGVSIENSPQNLIGCTIAPERNLISGNT